MADRYRDQLPTTGLAVTGRDGEGEPRIVDGRTTRSSSPRCYMMPALARDGAPRMPSCRRVIPIKTW